MLSKDSMFAELYGKLKEIDGAQIIVGVQGEEGKNFHGQTVSSSTELQKIAYVHEFGYDIEVTPKMRAYLHYNGIHLKAETAYIHIPERSYVRRAQTEGKSDINRLFNNLITQMLDGNLSVDEALDRIGSEMMMQVVKDLGTGTKPITNYTLEHRKNNAESNPLVDTGRLQNHITYRIVKKGDQS